jgi:hypothetical protein
MKFTDWCEKENKKQNEIKYGYISNQSNFRKLEYNC